MSAARQLREAFEFEHWLDGEAADRVELGEWGRAVLTPSLPRVWDASWISLERPGLDASAVLELAEQMLGGAGLDHRTVFPEDEADGRRLAAEFGGVPGWKVEPLLYMGWTRDSGRRAGTAAREVPMREVEELRRRVWAEHLPAEDDDPEATVAQLLEFDRRASAVTGDRWFCAEAGGEPVAACCLYAKGEVAQVEGVATLARWRGRGLAQAVVLAALDAARAGGAETVFLVAEADDWPRLMYEKLGFEPIGELSMLRRRPAPGAQGHRQMG